MKETQKENYVTIERFDAAMRRIDERFVTADRFEGAMSRIDARFGSFEAKMKEGFEIVFSQLEKMDQKMDDLMINKADKEDVFALHKRVSRLEKKIA